MHARFRTAVESGDLEAGLNCLHDDVVFHSPAVHRPYAGREDVGGLLRCVFDTFEDFRYTDELHADDGTATLVFRARVGDKELEGIDLLSRRYGSGARLRTDPCVRAPANLVERQSSVAPATDD